MTPSEKLTLVALYGSIVLVSGTTFAIATWLGTRYIAFAGIASIAYVFGLRHGFDADHIAAIDNVTRKLMQQGKRPLTVGTWFSIGHAMVVTGMCTLIALAARTTLGAVEGATAFASTGGLGIFSTFFSGAFLLVLGLINVMIVRDIYRIFTGLKTRQLDNGQLEETLAKRGIMNRVFGGLFRVVNEPWQMFPVGMVFGAGFDTATEVAIIGITVGVRDGSGRCASMGHNDTPPALRGRDHHRGHDRCDLDASGLRMGVPESNPEGVLQSLHNHRLGARRLRGGRRRDDPGPLGRVRDKRTILGLLERP